MQRAAQQHGRRLARQDLARGQELADRLMDETGGDAEEAERRFDAQVDDVRRRQD